MKKKFSKIGPYLAERFLILMKIILKTKISKIWFQISFGRQHRKYDSFFAISLK